MSNLRYGETVWSEVYAGSAHTVHCLRPAVLAAEIALDLAPERRPRVVWRLDGGSGSEVEMQWLVSRGYQLVAKGMNHNRANALAKQVKRWDACGDNWLGEVCPPTCYARPVRVLVKRQPDKHQAGQFHYSYYVTTLKLPSKSLISAQYDARGGAEVEQFRTDKSGLGLEARRKRNFLGQKAYILLTDLAHNLVSDFCHRGSRGSKLADYGAKRIVRDLLATPGNLVFEAGQLKRIELLSLKQNSEELLKCLECYVTGP